MWLETESTQSNPRALFFQRAYPHYQAAQRGAPEYLQGAKKLLEQLQVRVGAFSGHRNDVAHSDCCPKAQSKNAGFLFISFTNYELSHNYELCPECWKGGEERQARYFWRCCLLNPFLSLGPLSLGLLFLLILHHSISLMHHSFAQ